MLDEQAWDHLTRKVRGTLSFPADVGYAGCTPWNLAVPVEPAAVFVPADAGDVSEAVRWAAEHGLRVAVQCTGHSAMPVGDDVVLLHTGALDHLEIDPMRRTAVVGAGVRWGRVLEASAKHGLLPVCGSSPGTGVVGYLTGGGVGPMVRQHGLGSDRVRSFEVVTGDGELRHADATENRDLFWGLRGGKGTLGVVTSVEIDLVECASFFGGSVYFAAEDIPEVLRAWSAWSAWSAALSSEGTSSLCIVQLPDAPGVPEPLAGRMTVAVRFTWLGDATAGRTLVAQLIEAATPVLGGFDVMPAAQLPSVHQDPLDPIPFREFGYLLSDFPTEAADAMSRSAGPASGSPLVMVEIRQLGGAAHERPAVSDAVSGARDAAYNLMLGGVPVPDPGPVGAAADRVLDALAPWSTGAMMPNFVVRADDEAMSRFFDPDTLARLRTLADRFDPSGVLDIGQVARTRPTSGGKTASNTQM